MSVTLVDLTRWDKDYYFASGEELSTSKMLMNHLAAGVDFLPTDYMYLSLGYNFRKANEMKAAGSSHAAGLCAGAGILLSRFGFGLAYAQYHLSARLSSSTRPTACKDRQVLISAYTLL